MIRATTPNFVSPAPSMARLLPSPSSPAAFRKAQAEVREYRRWQQLCAELVDVSERICRLRPLPNQPEGWSAEEKKRLLRSIKKSRAN